MPQRTIPSFDELLKAAISPEMRLTGDDLLRYFAETTMANASGVAAPAPLAKAMGTGPGLTLYGQPGNPPLGDMMPTVLQNLDPVMTSVLYTTEHFRFMGMLPRKVSPTLVFEYTKRLSYGGARALPGFIEGGVPQGGAARYERDSARIRFMGELCGVTHPLMRATELGGLQLDAVAEENRNGTMRLLGKVETALFYADSQILSNNGVEVNYDGIYKQLTTSPYASFVVKDKQGKPLLPEDIEDAARQLFEMAYVLSFDRLAGLASPSVITDLSKLRFGIDRRMVEPGPYPPTRTGIPYEGHQSNFGFIPIQPHIFFMRVPNDVPVDKQFSGYQGADPGAPPTPTVGSITAAAVTDATSKLPAGTYVYTVASLNDSGESLPLYAAANATTAAGQNVTLTIQNVAGATAYRIYRGVASDGSDAKWIADVPANRAGTSTIFIDRNQKIPGSGTFLLWINDDETVVVPQFLPLLRWPLAVTTTTIQWLVLLYHTVVVKAPQRMVLFTNIGPLT